MGGGKGGGGTSTQYSGINIPPEVLARYNKATDRAETTSQQPWQNYTGSFVAPVNETQQAGYGTMMAGQGYTQAGWEAPNAAIQQGVNTAAPLMNQAGGQYNQAIQQGQQGTQNALSTGQQAFNTASPLTSGALAGAQGYNQAATGAAMAGMRGVDPSQLNLQQFMNPYQQDVIAATMGQLGQQQAQQRMDQRGNMIREGTFGGDRSGIANANMVNQQNLATGSVLSGLNQGNYQQALAAAQQQQGVGLGAAQANRAAFQQGAGQLANIGQQGFQQGMGASQQLYGQGMGLAGLQGQMGQQNYAQGIGGGQALQGLGTAGYGMYSDAAARQAALAQQAFGQNMQTAQGQTGFGTLQQQTQQAQDSAVYNQWLQERGYPFQTSQFYTNAVMGTGPLSGSTAYSGSFSPQPFFSDERVKDDITEIGKTHDGIPIIRFRYKGDSTPQIGLSAQDVEKRHPDAVGETREGVKTVDYLAATDHAARPHRAPGGGADPYSAGIGPPGGGGDPYSGGFAGLASTARIGAGANPLTPSGVPIGAPPGAPPTFMSTMGAGPPTMSTTNVVGSKLGQGTGPSAMSDSGKGAGGSPSLHGSGGGFGTLPDIVALQKASLAGNAPAAIRPPSTAGMAGPGMQGPGNPPPAPPVTPPPAPAPPVDGPPAAPAGPPPIDWTAVLAEAENGRGSAAEGGRVGFAGEYGSGAVQGEQAGLGGIQGGLLGGGMGGLSDILKTQLAMYDTAPWAKNPQGTGNAGILNISPAKASQMIKPPEMKAPPAQKSVASEAGSAVDDAEKWIDKGEKLYKAGKEGLYGRAPKGSPGDKDYVPGTGGLLGRGGERTDDGWWDQIWGTREEYGPPAPSAAGGRAGFAGAGAVAPYAETSILDEDLFKEKEASDLLKPPDPEGKKEAGKGADAGRAAAKAAIGLGGTLLGTAVGMPWLGTVAGMGAGFLARGGRAYADGGEVNDNEPGLAPAADAVEQDNVHYGIFSRSQGHKMIGRATTLSGARRVRTQRDGAFGGSDHFIKPIAVSRKRWAGGRAGFAGLTDIGGEVSEDAVQLAELEERKREEGLAKASAALIPDKPSPVDTSTAAPAFMERPVAPAIAEAPSQLPMGPPVPPGLGSAQATPTPTSRMSPHQQATLIPSAGGLGDSNPEARPPPDPNRPPAENPEHPDAVHGRMIYKVESGGNQFDPKTGGVLTSSANAKGIGQMLEGTAKATALKNNIPWQPDLFHRPRTGDPAKDEEAKQYNLNLSRLHYKELVDRYGDVYKGAAAYNTGEGNFDKLVAKATAEGKRWDAYLYDETQNYLFNISNGKYGRQTRGPTQTQTATNDPATATTAAPSALGAATTDPDAGRNFWGQKQGNWFDRNEGTILPLLSGIGGMLSSQSRTLAGSIGEGLGKGIDKYMTHGQRQQQLDISRQGQNIASAGKLSEAMGNIARERAGILARNPRADVSALDATYNQLRNKYLEMAGARGVNLSSTPGKYEDYVKTLAPALQEFTAKVSERDDFIALYSTAMTTQDPAERERLVRQADAAVERARTGNAIGKDFQPLQVSPEVMAAALSWQQRMQSAQQTGAEQTPTGRLKQITAELKGLLGTRADRSELSPAEQTRYDELERLQAEERKKLGLRQGGRVGRRFGGGDLFATTDDALTPAVATDADTGGDNVQLAQAPPPAPPKPAEAAPPAPNLNDPSHWDRKATTLDKFNDSEGAMQARAKAKALRDQAMEGKALDAQGRVVIPPGTQESAQTLWQHGQNQKVLQMAQEQSINAEALQQELAKYKSTLFDETGKQKTTMGPVTTFLAPLATWGHQLGLSDELVKNTIGLSSTDVEVANKSKLALAQMMATATMGNKQTEGLFNQLLNSGIAGPQMSAAAAAMIIDHIYVPKAQFDAKLYDHLKEGNIYQDDYWSRRQDYYRKNKMYPPAPPAAAAAAKPPAAENVERPASLSGIRNLEYSPSMKQFRDRDSGRTYDLKGDPTGGP